MKKIILGLGTIGILLFTGCASPGYTNMQEIDKLVSKGIPGNGSPWHIDNLYNKSDKSFFIPYQLWTGAKWDGDKNKPCMHKANSYFSTNGRSPTTIKGPFEWKNPETGSLETIWKREKEDGSKEQYFTCHKKGIGRVYDSRGGVYSNTGKCKFPAGFGWKIGQRVKCLETAIEITAISFDKKNNLNGLEFKFWYQNKRNGNLVLDHIYWYEPNVGMLTADQQ